MGTTSSESDNSNRFPVFNVHCITWAMAREVCHVQAPQGFGLATAFGQVDTTGLLTFRARRPYRTAAAVELRRKVAHIVRAKRQAPGHSS